MNLRHEHLINILLQIDAATCFVTFVDKHLASAAVMKSYVSSDLCQTRSQQSLR